MAEEHVPEPTEVEHNYLDVGPTGPRRWLLVIGALVILAAIVTVFFGLYTINRGASPTLTPEPVVLTQAALAKTYGPDGVSPGSSSISSTVTPTPTQTFAVTATAQPTTYTVQQGDTLIGIAERLNVNMDNLTALNQLSSETILPSQVLLVPPTVTPGPASGPVSHVVSRGETLISIAAIYRVTVDELKALNGLTSDTILVDQHILIPARGVPPPTPTPTPEPWAAAVVTGDLESVYSLTKTNGQFTLHILPDTLAATSAEIAQLVETALDHSQQALQRRFPGSFEVYVSDSLFEAPYTVHRSFIVPDANHLFLLYDGKTTLADRVYFATYGVTKLVAAHILGEAASPLLAEGLAVYTAGHASSEAAAQSYGYISLDQFCTALQQVGTLPQVTQPLAFESHLGHFDQYLAAGCFVGYLVETKGLAAFGQVYLTGDYQAVYGKTLEQLVSDWTATLRAAAEESSFGTDELVRIVTEVNGAYRHLWTDFEGTPAQFAAYERLDRARLALLQGRLRAASAHLEMLKEIQE